MSTKVASIGKQTARRVVTAGREVTREVATMLASAFGIVAALGWSDAVKGVFDSLQIFKKWPLVGPFAFAIIVTVAAYLASVLMAKLVKEQCTKICPADTCTRVCDFPPPAKP